MAKLGPVNLADDTQELLRAANEQLRQEVDERKRIENKLLRNNRHMQEELRMAAELQHAVLPEIIDVPYLETCLIYRPLGGVSGDVYDFILNREKDLSVFLGDATGHGIAAALMTMMVLLGLDSIRPNLPTDESLRRLNQLIASRDTGRFVSGVYFRVTQQGLLTVTHAGHPSLIVIPANGDDLKQFSGGGCALGVFEDEPVAYEEEVYQLAVGDKLFAYTDAVIERYNSDKEVYGLDRLLDFLDASRALSIQQITEQLMTSLHKHAQETPSHDDLSVLVFEYCGLDNKKGR